MDISFYCFKCGQHIVIDAAGAGVSVPCPKCQAALVVPSAQAEQSPVRQGERLALPPRKPKRRLGLIGIVGVVLVFLGILRAVLIANRWSMSPVTLTGALGLEKRVNTLNGSYSTGPLYPPRRSDLYGGHVIQDPPYTLSLDFSDDGTVFSASNGHVVNRGTYQISDRKIRFAWDDPKQPVEAEMQGDVIFWGNGRYERK